MWSYLSLIDILKFIGLIRYCNVGGVSVEYPFAFTQGIRIPKTNIHCNTNYTTIKCQIFQSIIVTVRYNNADGLSRLPPRFRFEKEEGNVTVTYNNAESDNSANIELADQTEVETS